MSPRMSSLLRVVCLLLIPVMLTVGCAKRDAAKSIAQAKTAKDEAQQARAPGYAAQAFNDANRLLNLADTQFNNGEYKQAIDTANQAQARFITAKEQVPAVKQRVDAQILQIEQALTAAEQNVQKARDTGGKPEDINPVAQIVEKLRQRLVEGEFRTETNEEKLKAFLAEIQDAGKQTDALATANLKPQAAKAKDDVQKLITRAQELKAEKHEADRFAQVQTQFAAIEAAEKEGQWQKVIDECEKLKTPLNEVIASAQQKSAGDILADLLDKINQAKLLNIQNIDAFTSSVTQAEAAVKKGQGELQSQNYTAAIASSEEAKNLLNQAYKALGQEAQKMVDAAKNSLQEALKQEADKYAPTVVAQVKESIAGIEELLKKEQFNAAFTAARQTAQVSANAVIAARRGKAQLEIAQAETPFSVLHGQGGAQYVPEAYQAALTAIQDLRNKVKNEQFDAVEAGVPAAVEAVNKGLQTLTKTAADYIGKAQAALDDAKTAKATDWVGMQYANAVNLMNAAEKEVEKQRFLTCIRTAEASIQTSREAEGRAYRLQTEQNLRKADELVALAKRAEQDRLSPLAFGQALKTKEETLDLVQKNQFKEAYHRSVATVEASNKALNNLVITAREKCDSALAAEAMKYAQPEITQALSLLNEAEEAQQAEQFSVANEKAQESAKIADQGEYLTWKQRSDALLRQMEGTKEILDGALAPEKTPALYHEALASLAEANVKQIDQEYKASYQSADQARQTKEKIRQSMREELNRVLTELKQTADWMGENALDSGGREIKIALMGNISELERWVALESWKEAYAAARKAEQTAQKATGALQSHNRKILASQMKEALAPYKKQKALSIVPEQAKQFKETFASLGRPKKGDTYATAQEKYQASSKEIKGLTDAIGKSTTQRTEEITTILQQADQAGAQKFFKDWYRSLASELQWLRNASRGSDYKGIAEHLKVLEKEAPQLLLAVKNAVAEDDYLQALDADLNQLNDVINKFGYIAQMPKKLIVTARATEHAVDKTNIDMYRALQGKISATTLRINAESLEDRVKDLKPPKSLESVQKKAVASFTHFRKAAQDFELYGESEAYDIHFREHALNDAYNQLDKTLALNEDLRFAITSQRKMTFGEKLNWKSRHLEDRIGKFYYSYSD